MPEKKYVYIYAAVLATISILGVTVHSLDITPTDQLQPLLLVMIIFLSAVFIVGVTLVARFAFKKRND